MTELELQVWAATYAAMFVERYARGSGPDAGRAIRVADDAVEQLREAAASDYFDSIIADHYDDERERAESADAESRAADDAEAP